MGIPTTISSMGKAAYKLPDISKSIINPKSAGTRTTLDYTLHPYLEVAFQSKHDATLYGYCLRKDVNVKPRGTDGNQVPNKKNLTADQMLSDFYPERAQTAAEIVMQKVSAALTKDTPTGSVAIRVGVQIDAAVQAIVQTDNYRYEVSYWYDTRDIYLLFHCYPA